MEVQNTSAPFAEQKPPKIVMNLEQIHMKQLLTELQQIALKKIVLNLEIFLKRSQQLWVLCVSECINLCSGPWRDSMYPIFRPSHTWPMTCTVKELAYSVRNGTSKRAGVSSFNDVFRAPWFL